MPASQPGPAPSIDAAGDARSVSVRLALFYGAVFALIGFHLPFWPVWLADRGLGPTEIGIVLAVGVGIKIVANPLVAGVADRHGLRRPIMMALAIAATAAFALFGLTTGLWSILLVTALFFAAWSPIMPLGESLAMLSGRMASEARGREFDYGRVRAWGSMTFIAAAVGGGALFAGRPAELIFWSILATMGVTAAATWGLPRTAAPKAEGRRLAALELLRDRRFCTFIVAAALIQSSHSVYYGFGTLNWKAAGYGEDVIGLLWAEGVLAEIVLFAFGARLVGRVGPGGLIALGGLAGVVRWTVTGATDAFAVIVVMQALHAFTFGATHLGAIHFIAGSVPAQVSASAQSLYSAVVMGLALGLAALASGKLYGLFGAAAYQAMAVLALAGLVAALALAGRRRDP